MSLTITESYKRRLSELAGINKNSDDRKLGKSLESQFATPFVTIYRAAPMSSNEFFDKDYVTLSKKFAIEHAENNHIYHEEPQHVIQAIVSTKNVFDAYNQGEYFYSGPNKKAREIYITKGEEFEGLNEVILEAKEKKTKLDAGNEIHLPDLTMGKKDLLKFLEEVYNLILTEK